MTLSNTYNKYKYKSSAETLQGMVYDRNDEQYMIGDGMSVYLIKCLIVKPIFWKQHYN